MNTNFQRGGAVAARVLHRHQVAGSSPVPATNFTASTGLVGMYWRVVDPLWLGLRRVLFWVWPQLWRLGDDGRRLALSRVKPACNDRLEDVAPKDIPLGEMARLNSRLLGITKEAHA
jgi:hypothetical protein